MDSTSRWDGVYMHRHGLLEAEFLFSAKSFTSIRTDLDC